MIGISLFYFEMYGGRSTAPMVKKRKKRRKGKMQANLQEIVRASLPIENIVMTRAI